MSYEVWKVGDGAVFEGVDAAVEGEENSENLDRRTWASLSTKISDFASNGFDVT